MKLVFGTADITKGLPISDSNGQQVAIGIMTDGGDCMVCFVDKYLNSLFIEKIINKFAMDFLTSGNMNVVEDEEEFKTCFNFFKEKGIIPEGHYG